MTRRALFATVASLACVTLCQRDDDNPERTAEDMARARPAAEVLPEHIGQKATDELMRDDIELRAEPEEPIDWSGCPLVESVPGRMSGAWVLKGTQMPVAAIVDNRDAGATVENILEWFELEREPVEGVLAYADSQRFWARLAPMQARNRAKLRAMLKAEGRDPDRMSEDELEDYITDYVDRIIHEYRAEQRAKEQTAS